MIKLGCEKCGHVLHLKDEMAGKKGRCPRCGTSLTIPGGSRMSATPSLLVGDSGLGGLLPPNESAATQEHGMSQWFCMKDGKKRGPLDTTALKQLAIDGELTPTDRIWREGLAQWIPASQSKGLFPEPVLVSEPEEITIMASSSHEAVISPPPAPALPTTAPRYACSVCGGLFPVGGVYDDNGVITCKRCFAECSSPAPRWPTQPQSAAYAAQPRQPAGGAAGAGLIVAGYVCGGVALLFCPPGFGIAGIVIGIVNITRGAIGHGIAQIGISVGCTMVGMMLGAAAWS